MSKLTIIIFFDALQEQIAKLEIKSNFDTFSEKPNFRKSKNFLGCLEKKFSTLSYQFDQNQPKCNYLFLNKIKTAFFFRVKVSLLFTQPNIMIQHEFRIRQFRVHF